MTHPTDEELDALAKRLREPWSQRQSRRVLEEFDAADTITILRDQIAELRAELARRVDMHECAMAERDDATLYSEEQKARAEQAEAALAALVEALESIRKASLCSGSRETARAALARVKGGG